MNVNLSINIDKHDSAHAYVNGSTYTIKSIIDINNKFCKMGKGISNHMGDYPHQQAHHNEHTQLNTLCETLFLKVVCVCVLVFNHQWKPGVSIKCGFLSFIQKTNGFLGIMKCVQRPLY